MLEKDLAIFVFKPDGLKRSLEKLPLQLVVEALFASVGLSIERQSQKQLTECDIRGIYRILNLPSEYGEDWKCKVIAAMQKSSVLAYLLRGRNAENKAKLIKNLLRQNLTDQTNETCKIIMNIAHVADTEDLETSTNILFFDK